MQLIGNPVAAQYWTLELGLAERIRVDINQPLAQAVTVSVYRPGVTDATIDTAKPAYTRTVASTVTPLQAAFFADTSGTWIVRATAAAPTTFTMTGTRLQAPTPNPRERDYSTVLNAPGLVVGTLYSATTFDADATALVAPRIARIGANQDDRVKVALAVTNRKGLRVEIFAPGTTDASIDTAEPVASIDLPISGAAMTLAFTAEITGDYLIRAMSTAVAPATVIKPTTFTVQLADVAPSDLQPPCADEITNIGRTRVKGCLEAGPGGVYVATEPVTMSGIVLEPVGNAKITINPRTLEVTSTGEFVPVIWSIRLPTTNYFEFSGSLELNLLDPTKNQDGSTRDPSKTGADQTGDQRGLTWTDVTDGRGDVDGPQVGGLPLTGKITIEWGLDNGGQAKIGANANIPGWDITGALTFAVSNDNGLDYANVSFGSSGAAGLTFNANLGYKEELVGGMLISVWTAGFKADVGSTVPPAMLAGGQGALEIRDGVLSYVRVGVNTNIPIGNTGIFVTRLGASLRWSPYFAISGFGSVAVGPAVAGVPVIEITGEGGFADGGSCPGSTAVGDRWFFDGSAAIAKWFTVANFGVCYQGAEQPFVYAYTDAGFSAVGVVEGRASLKGYIDGSRAMMIEGNANMKVFGVSADGTVVLSDYGFAACGAAKIKFFGLAKRVAIGYEKPWSGDGTGGFACPDFSPFRTVFQPRTARAIGDWPVVVPTGAEQVNVIVVGADGKVPGVDVLDASGRVVASSASTTENSSDNALFIPQPDTGEMIIAAPIAKAGTYRIRAQAGSSISTIRTSLPLADVGIDAHVAMRGTRATLTYALSDLAGRTVEFWETGDGVGRRIGVASSATGAIAFRTDPSLGAQRRIEAVVLTDGVPAPKRTVTTFTAPRLRAPAAPTGLRITRSGAFATIRWDHAARATSYRLRLVDSDGRRVDTELRGRSYRLRLSRGSTVLAEVTALGYGEQRSRPARVRVGRVVGS